MIDLQVSIIPINPNDSCIEFSTSTTDDNVFISFGNRHTVIKKERLIHLLQLLLSNDEESSTPNP